MTAHGVSFSEQSVTYRGITLCGVVSRVGELCVRAVDDDDRAAIIEMGRKMHADSVYSFLPFDVDKANLLITRCIVDPSHVGLVAERNGDYVGFFMGYACEYFFSSERIACDLLLYTRPHRRGSFAGKMMIDAYVKWAASQGVAEVCAGVSAMTNNERTYKLYERCGFTEVGRVFKKKLKGD